MRGPGQVYREQIEPVWESVSIYDGGDTFLAHFSNLNELQRHLFAAHWCHSEVCNGGFHQFFSNPTGVLAPEAAVAFEAIGLPDATAIIRQAIEFFGSPYPRDQMERRNILDSISGDSRADWDPFYTLDDPFYAVVDFPNCVFERAADAYALKSAFYHPKSDA